jgi:eukaryotic-like serine/threonine-protein kinase
MASRQMDEEAIFHIARKLNECTDQTKYLEQVCASDQTLRERVEALLAVHKKEREFLNSSPLMPPPTVVHTSITEALGQQIGRYKLLQQIGEDGFGVVYMAEQARPIRCDHLQSICGHGTLTGRS